MENNEQISKKKLAVQALIERGKKNGVLSYKEIMDTLETTDLDPEQIEKIYDKLES